MSKTTLYDSTGTQTSSTDSLGSNASSNSSTSSGSTSSSSSGSSVIKYDIGPLTAAGIIYKNNAQDLVIPGDQNYNALFYKASSAMTVTSYVITGNAKDNDNNGAAFAFGITVSKINSNGGTTVLATVDPASLPAYSQNVGARTVFATPISLAQDDMIRFKLNCTTTVNVNCDIACFFQVTLS